MAGYVPPGWPTGVHPPGSEDFERTAACWLLELVPPDYRLYGVLRRHPLALATLAGHHLRGCVDAARQGYRRARTELGDDLPAHALSSVLAAYRAEGRRLVAASRSVELVTQALRGEEFTPRLRETEQPAQRRPGTSGAASSASPTRHARSAARAATSRESR